MPACLRPLRGRLENLADGNWETTRRIGRPTRRRRIPARERDAEIRRLGAPI